MNTSNGTDFHKEISLDGKLYPLMSDRIAVQNINPFSRRQVTGDYTVDHNDILSSIVYSDLSSGHGIDEVRSTDDTRYRIGTMYTRFPRKIIPQRMWSAIDLAAAGWPVTGSPRILGDLYRSGTWKLLVTIDDDVYQVGTGASLGNFGSASRIPVNPGCTFQGAAADDYMVVPLGAGGFGTINATTGTVTRYASVDLVHAVTFDDEIIGIDDNGQLWHSGDLSGGVWTDYGSSGKLPSSYVPKRLVSFYSRTDESAIFVVTERAIFQFDPAGPFLVRIGDEKVTHPDNGIAACTWSGDMYSSMGMGIERHSGGAVMNIGLDRDDGLPLEYQGYIQELSPGYNGLYAAVTRRSADPLSTRSSIHEFSGSGWHMIYQTQDYIHSQALSVHDGNYRMYIATSNTGVYGFGYVDLSRSFANSRANVLSGVEFDYSGQYIEFGRFDGLMPGYRKIASHVSMDLDWDTDTYPSSPPNSRNFQISYRIDQEKDWTTLGSVVIGLGENVRFFGDNGAFGIDFETIDIRIDMGGSGVTTSGDGLIIENVILAYLKIPQNYASWRFNIDLNDAYKGRSPAEMRSDLIDLMENRRFVPMILNDTGYRVYLTQRAEEIETGRDERGVFSVSAIQIPPTGATYYVSNP